VLDTTDPRPRRQRARRTAPALVLAAALLATTAACGEDGKNSGSTPSATSSTAGTDAAAAARAAVDKLLVAPSALGVTDPLKAKPAGLGPIVYLSCENALCQQIAKGLKAASAAAGVPFKNQTIKLADPATLVAGMQQALAMKPKPSGVVFAGLPEAVWGSQLPAFAAAKVPLIPIAVGATSNSPALPAGSLDGPADGDAQATAIANYFIADSGGKGKALVLNVPDVGLLKSVTEKFQSTVKSGCPECSSTTVDVTLAQVASNGVVPAIVSALQREKDVDYVVTVQGEFTQGLLSAAKAAGIENLKLIGINPTITNQQEIANGQARAFTLLPFQIMGWLAMDVALRYAQGLEIADGNGGLPLQLLTKETVGTPAASLDRPEDYQNQFKKLWLVG
jgi:ribose transport system substrate-binding protein